VHELEYTEIDDLLAIPPILCPPRIIEFDLPPHISPPPIERDRQSLGGPQQRPLSPPVTPSAAYNPQLGHAEPEITTTEREDSTRLEHLAATHAPSRVVSKEDFALLGGYYKIHGRYRFVHAFLCILCATYDRLCSQIPGFWESFFTALHRCRVDIDRCKLFSVANWGFRTVSTDSGPRLTSRKCNLV
jgi:hypothetical protein